MKPVEQTLGKLAALLLSPKKKARQALVLLHGLGGNERDSVGIGADLAPERLIVALRAPLRLGPESFAWYEPNFQSKGPIHNWKQAQKSFFLIQEALADLSKKTCIPADKISIFGFSQGGIMTVGLILQAPKSFESYLICSGRTLPEFADGIKKSSMIGVKARRAFVAHGISDSNISIKHARKTKIVFRSVGLKMKYKEYSAGHEITRTFIADAHKWLGSKD